MSRTSRFAQIVGPFSAHDEFNRADSTSQLGTGWTAHSGTWGITGNQAYASAGAGDNVATRPTKSGQRGYVQATFTPGVGGSGLVCRAQNDQNYILLHMANPSGKKLEFYKRVAGAYTLIAQTAYAYVDATAYVLRLEFDGSSLTGKVNGATVLTASDGALLTNARAGLRVFGATAARWNNFEAS